MTEELDISPKLSLPLDWVTQRSALLAMSGAGKSNAARAIGEEFWSAKLPFVAVDPKGDWWGLRSGRDGSPEGGIDVAIFGGKHGDVPLARDGGKFVADLVVGERLSCILDLSEFDSEEDKNRFLLDFATRIYRTNEDPLHLFLDEADEIVPQSPTKEQVQLLRIFEFIVRKGRTKGLGVTMLSQRSALLNKNVLTQIETLFAMRTSGPQDIAAIEAWMKNHGGDREMLATLPTLGSGEAWVWSPRYLGRMERIQFRLSHTFDSGATPKNNQRGARRSPAKLSDLDVGALRERMAETIAKIEAEDPRVLRARIADLEKELRQAHRQSARGSEIPKPEARSPKPEVDLLPWRQWVGRLRAELELEQREREALAQRLGDLEAHQGRIEQASEGLVRALAMRPPAYVPGKVTLAEIEALAERKMPGEPAERRLAKSPQASNGVSKVATEAVPAPSAVVVAAAAVVDEGESTSGATATLGDLGDGAQKILSALARKGTMSRVRLAIVCGYRHDGGGYATLLSTLRGAGLVRNVDDSRGAPYELTQAGRERAKGLPPPMDGVRLSALWCKKLGTAAWKSFEVMLGERRRMTTQELATATGYKKGGGSFNDSLRELKEYGLCVGGRNQYELGEAAEDFS